MIPKSFDPDTAKTVIGDARTRVIEEKARADAEGGVDAFSPPVGESSSYWSSCQLDFERSVYLAQFKKRLERNQRKSIQ